MFNNRTRDHLFIRLMSAPATCVYTEDVEPYVLAWLKLNPNIQITENEYIGEKHNGGSFTVDTTDNPELRQSIIDFILLEKIELLD